MSQIALVGPTEAPENKQAAFLFQVLQRVSAMMNMIIIHKQVTYRLMS